MTVIPPDAQVVEMVDGRVFYSTDRWESVYLISAPGKKARRISGRQADLARFLAIHAH